MKILLALLLLTNLCLGQSTHWLDSHNSRFIYNNGADTIHLSEIIKIDYQYCNANDTIEESSPVGSGFPRFGKIRELPTTEYQSSSGIDRHNYELDVDFAVGQFISDSLAIIDSMQVDGIGNKEIAFYRSFTIFSHYDGATWTSNTRYCIHKVEIWNPDAKKLLFEKVIYFDEDGSNNDLGLISESKRNRFFQLECQISPMGVITLSDKLGFIERYMSSMGHSASIDPLNEPSTLMNHPEIEIHHQVCSWLTTMTYEFVGGKYELMIEER